MQFKAKLKNQFTGKIVEVKATTDTPDSLPGMPVCVDTDSNGYPILNASLMPWDQNLHPHT
jgi:hypothetical protein